jgi:outer membrane protein OmpA-like peptidoglycan-associated protein
VLGLHDVGYYLDVLQGRLQQSVDPAVIVSRASDSIVLDFSRRVGFTSGAAQLDDANRAVLMPLSKTLAEYRMTLVSIRVSVDDDSAGARSLAQQRAAAIAHALEESGIVATRIKMSVPEGVARDGDAHVEIELEPVMRGE